MVLKVSLNTGINRIRLEFKAFSPPFLSHITTVLIESDWNLKPIHISRNKSENSRINRIRLEFKVFPLIADTIFPKSINRIRLEFKVNLSMKVYPAV